MEDVDKQYCDKPESVQRPMHVGDGRVRIDMDNIRPFQGGSRKRKSRRRKSRKRKSRKESHAKENHAKEKINIYQFY